MIGVELRQLRYFVTVAEELHLGRAAARLGITTPTLSQQIKAVERQVGAPLLVRQGRGISLTPAGRVLVREARKTMRAAEDALRETRRVAGVAGACLRIGVPAGVPPWLPARIARLQPDCRMEPVRASTGAQLGLLDGGEVDLALVRCPVTLPPGTRMVEVAEEEMGVLMAAGNRLAARADIDIAELAGRELVWIARDQAPGFHDAVIDRLRGAGGDVGLDPRRGGPAEWRSALLDQPDAISLSTRRAADTPDLVWRPLRGRPLTVSYAAVWRTDSRNAALRAVVRELSKGKLRPPPQPQTAVRQRS
jgi:DNA-binding transcriptional LysR family regulator